MAKTKLRELFEYAELHGFTCKQLRVRANGHHEVQVTTQNGTQFVTTFPSTPSCKFVRKKKLHDLKRIAKTLEHTDKKRVCIPPVPQQENQMSRPNITETHRTQAAEILDKLMNDPHLALVSYVNTPNKPGQLVWSLSKSHMYNRALGVSSPSARLIMEEQQMGKVFDNGRTRAYKPMWTKAVNPQEAPKPPTDGLRTDLGTPPLPDYVQKSVAVVGWQSNLLDDLHQWAEDKTQPTTDEVRQSVKYLIAACNRLQLQALNKQLDNKPEPIPQPPTDDRWNKFCATFENEEIEMILTHGLEAMIEEQKAKAAEAQRAFEEQSRKANKAYEFLTGG